MAKKNVTFKIEEESINRIRKVAKKEKRSLNQFVEILFDRQPLKAMRQHLK